MEHLFNNNYRDYYSTVDNPNDTLHLIQLSSIRNAKYLPVHLFMLDPLTFNNALFKVGSDILYGKIHFNDWHMWKKLYSRTEIKYTNVDLAKLLLKEHLGKFKFVGDGIVYTVGAGMITHDKNVLVQAVMKKNLPNLKRLYHGLDRNKISIYKQQITEIFISSDIFRIPKYKKIKSFFVTKMMADKTPNVDYKILYPGKLIDLVYPEFKFDMPEVGNSTEEIRRFYQELYEMFPACEPNELTSLHGAEPEPEVNERETFLEEAQLEGNQAIRRMLDDISQIPEQNFQTDERFQQLWQSLSQNGP